MFTTLFKKLQNCGDFDNQHKHVVVYIPPTAETPSLFEIIPRLFPGY